jgi:phosphoribosylamine--glycine ligase
MQLTEIAAGRIVTAFIITQMKVLVIGGGGREHALVWKIKQSPLVEKIWCLPGNDGIANEAECHPIEVSNIPRIVEFAEDNQPDLVVIGPELPLVLGLADELRARGLAVVGPGKKSARLEGSKVFAKEFMQRHKIPTAKMHGVYGSPIGAKAALDRLPLPIVVKADGLCGGKGVLVADTKADAGPFLDHVMDVANYSGAGRPVVLEEKLIGEELSYIILTDGRTVVPMAPCRDYKRAFDGDLGGNTGGMGAFSVDGLLAPEIEDRIQNEIVKPTLDGLAKEGIPYTGFLYFGLMLTADGPRLLEYNCRLGDPETQAIVLRADFDFAKMLLDSADGRLKDSQPNWSPAASVYVVLAAAGYPDRPRTGDPISGLDAVPSDGVAIFHAATRRLGDTYYTGSGRVLGVGASGPSLDSSRAAVYDAISIISFEGYHYRSDIGAFPKRHSPPSS